jgi:hypothetical protein
LEWRLWSTTHVVPLGSGKMALRNQMSTAVEKILEEVQQLTPIEREELLNALEKTAFRHSAHGKYAHVRTSSEEFCARKMEEVALEERRRPA